MFGLRRKSVQRGLKRRKPLCTQPVAAVVERLESRLCLSSQSAWAAQLTAPSSITGESQPVFTWNRVLTASGYELWVYNRGTGQESLHVTGLVGTSYQPASGLAAGNYTAYLRTWRADQSAWGRPLEFTVVGAAGGFPAAPQLAGPANGAATADTTPEIVFTPIAGAASYELLVYHTSTGRAAIDVHTGGTSFTPKSSLAPGTHQVFLRAVDQHGSRGRWSSAFYFNVVPPDAPALVGPIPNRTTRYSQPTIQWTAVEGAIRYELYLYDDVEGRELSHAANVTDTCFELSSPLATGRYQILVRAFNDAGWAGRWMSALFAVDPHVGTPSPRLSGGGQQTWDFRPTIIWKGTPETTSYELLLYDAVTGSLVEQASTAATQFTPSQSLLAGSHRVFVRSIDERGQVGRWGSLDFNVGDGSRVLYVNFEGIGISRSQLEQWAAGDWHPGGIDADGDGVQVAGFLPDRIDRDALIAQILQMVQDDLQPFGVRVQRHFGSAVTGVGATTIFVGDSSIAGSDDRSGIAGDLDIANNNWTDVAFVDEEDGRDDLDFGDTTGAIRWWAHIIAHEAGHTYGLYHVNTDQNGVIHPDAMGFAYTVDASNRWHEYPQHADVGFLDQWFAEFEDHGYRPEGESQNSYQRLRQNFVGTYTGRRQLAD